MNGSRPRSEKIKVKSENDSENLSRSLCVELGREHKKINWNFYFSILAIGREKFCFLLRVFFLSSPCLGGRGDENLWNFMSAHFWWVQLMLPHRWHTFPLATDEKYFYIALQVFHLSIGYASMIRASVRWISNKKRTLRIFDTLHFFYGAIVCHCSQCLLGAKQWK